MRRGSSLSILVFPVILCSGIALALAIYGSNLGAPSIWIGITALAWALIVSRSINVADQWEKAIRKEIRK